MGNRFAVIARFALDKSKQYTNLKFYVTIPLLNLQKGLKMFHICFAANEPYIKYTAVLITSIVRATDKSKSFKDFFAPRERERERVVQSLKLP